MTKCNFCKKETNIDAYPETKLFCSQNCLNANNQAYFDYNVIEYINENIYEIVRENRDVAIEVLRP